MDENGSPAQAEVAPKPTTETTPAVAKSDSLINPGKEQNELRIVDREANVAKAREAVMQEIEAATAGHDEPPAKEAPAPATETVETEEAPAATEEAKTSEDGDGDKLPERIRLTNFSKVEKLALTMKRENPKLSLAQAEAKARDVLGIAEEVPAGEKETAAATATVETVSAKITTAIAARTKAMKDDLDFAEADRLTNEIEALKDERASLREQEGKQSTAKQTAYDAAFDAAQAKAVTLYEFVKEPESAGYKRMAEIDAQLGENKDPLYHSPDKALVIAQMVARELQIAPKSAAKAVVKPATVPVVQKKVVPPVASGASRTSSTTTQGDGLRAKVQGLRTAADVQDFIESLGR